MQKTILFLLHFAGGNAYSFRFLNEFLRDFEVVPLELPGRGGRIKEPLIKDFDLAAQDLYIQILAKGVTAGYMIYGHSMGAYLALRVANMLERAGKPPLCILVSGNPGPGIREQKVRHLLGAEEFKAELRDLGGIPEEILQDQDVFGLFEPILRADFEIIEKADLINEPATSVPLFAMMGNGEEDADKIGNWERFTRSQFGSEILNGDHFFIYKNPGKVADRIKCQFAKSSDLLFT